MAPAGSGAPSTRPKRSRTVVQALPLQMERLFHRPLPEKRRRREATTTTPEGTTSVGGSVEDPPRTTTTTTVENGLEVLCETPRIYKKRNFLSESELEHLDTLVTASLGRWRRSTTDDGATAISNDERTSLTLGLAKFADARLRAIERRACELVGCGADRCEPLQLVAYENGARFDLHHDAGAIVAAACDADVEDLAADRAALERIAVETARPRRVVTIFVYLTSHADCGATVFPLAGTADGGLRVLPERGAAVVWCNVDRDGAADPALVHRAEPVPSPSRKFGLNVFITDANLAGLAAPHPPWLRTAIHKHDASGRPGLLRCLLRDEAEQPEETASREGGTAKRKKMTPTGDDDADDPKAENAAAARGTKKKPRAPPPRVSE